MDPKIIKARDQKLNAQLEMRTHPRNYANASMGEFQTLSKRYDQMVGKAPRSGKDKHFKRNELPPIFPTPVISTEGNTCMNDSARSLPSLDKFPVDNLVMKTTLSNMTMNAFSISCYGYLEELSFQRE